MKRMIPSSQWANKGLQLVLAVAAVGATTMQPSHAQEKVLRIAMTAADIPRTLGQPDQGFEGNRFTGIPMYDALTHWDLSSADKASVLIPGLATSWSVNANDKTKWTFKLRSGVKFHDGSPFNADAVVWNVQKVLDKDAVHFDASQVGVTASRMPTLRSARKIDDLTVELTTSEPDSFLPLNLTNLFARIAVHDQFGDHGVIKRADGVALTHAIVDAHAGVGERCRQRLAVHLQSACGGQELLIRIFSADACLDGVTLHPEFMLGQGQGLCIGHA